MPIYGGIGGLDPLAHLRDPPMWSQRDLLPPKPPELPKTDKARFLSAILADNPNDVLRWHAQRTGAEQQRFVKVMDDLYCSYRDKRKVKTAKPPPARQPTRVPVPRMTQSCDNFRLADAYPVDALDDASSVVESLASRPVSYASRGASVRSSKSAPDLAGNTLKRWVETRSIAPSSAATEWTSLSQMTKTSAGSVQSAPCTKFTLDYRRHARGFALNRRKWKTKNAHVPEAELVTDGMPEDRRLTTTYGRDFGVVKKGSTLRKETGLVGFKTGCHGFLDEYLDNAPSAAKEAFCQVGRSMNTFQNDRHYTTSTKRSYDLEKNSVLWRPPKTEPLVKDTYASSVPLGSLASQGGNKEVPFPAATPCPTVSMPPADSCKFPTGYAAGGRPGM